MIEMVIISSNSFKEQDTKDEEEQDVLQYQVKTSHVSLEEAKYFEVLKKRILKLPTDIKKAMYKEYFELPLLHQEVLSILRSQASQRLNHRELVLFLPSIIRNARFVDFLRKNDDIFDCIFLKHIVLKEKCFRNLLPIDSMALAWLMYLYH